MKKEKINNNNDEEKQNMMLIYNELINSIAVPERLLKLTHSDNQDTQHVNVKESLNDVICLLDYEAKRKGITSISLEATDMGRPLYEKFGFVKMNDEMELPTMQAFAKEDI